MAKKSNHRTVVFLTDYATKKAGEEWACDGMLARSLVNAGVAEYKKEVAIEADDAPMRDAAIDWEEDVHDLGEVNTIQMDGIELHESEEVFNPLPEVTEENSNEEKVSEPLVPEVQDETQVETEQVVETTGDAIRGIEGSKLKTTLETVSEELISEPENPEQPASDKVIADKPEEKSKQKSSSKQKNKK